VNTPAQYQQLWDTAVIREKNKDEINSLLFKIKKNGTRYLSVSNATHVPWYVIAVIHNMEASLNFTRHLHNGDKLTARTTHVPAGRPLAGNPPFTWEESAVDALTMQGMTKITDWSVPNILLTLEKYNGGGYAKRGINTPYLWAATNHYGDAPNIGKYVADGHFDPKAISIQIGAAALLKGLI